MADFVSAYRVVLRDNGDGTYTVANVFTGTTSASDGDASDNAFDPGETIAVTVSGNTSSYDFVGHAGNGWLGSSSTGTLRLFTNDSYTIGTVITLETDAFAVCFLPGTLIATPGGAVAIETLKAGALVLTSEGAAKPVRWLARQTIHQIFADPLRVLPIRIAAGALGENLPLRDLYVSPDHALLVGGLLVQAGALVNGSSITRHAAMPRSFVYYHVELADHSLVLAEGVPAETFVDNVTRRRFDNWREVPVVAPIAEMDRPRVKAWRQLPPPVRALLAERAAMLGVEAERDVA